MKLGIVTAFHGRPELTAMWAEHTAQFGLPVYVAVTEGDEANRATCELHGFVFREMPNNPVGSKFQAALDMAMADGCDRVMILGSDDFVSPEWIDRAQTFDAPYFTPDSCAVHDPRRGTYLIRFNGRSVASGGAGRVVSAHAVSKAGGLWTLGRNKSLDNESHSRLRAAGYTCKVVPCKRVPVVDVKSGVNIWGWETWRRHGHRCSDVDALHMLSPAMRDAIPSVCAQVPLPTSPRPARHR